ncbi:hypothetical protein VTN00DRAFT_5044 [Thermoascus crustaceus]|uniref:uncharacterized protein n=1 Tax=Thermoascus crustaceus TaxID=5088 RepID=UPI003743D4DC
MSLTTPGEVGVRWLAAGRRSPLHREKIPKDAPALKGEKYLGSVAAPSREPRFSVVELQHLHHLSKPVSSSPLVGLSSPSLVCARQCSTRSATSPNPLTIEAFSTGRLRVPYLSCSGHRHSLLTLLSSSFSCFSALSSVCCALPGLSAFFWPSSLNTAAYRCKPLLLWVSPDDYCSHFTYRRYCHLHGSPLGVVLRVLLAGVRDIPSEHRLLRVPLRPYPSSPIVPLLSSTVPRCQGRSIDSQNSFWSSYAASAHFVDRQPLSHRT